MSGKSAHPLLYVALGAIFLFVFFGVRTFNSNAGFGLATMNVPFTAQASTELSSSQMLGPETPELVLVSKSGIKASTPPVTVTPKVLGAIVGQVDTDVKPDILRYEVESGDTIASVAKKFGISTNTIVWANNLQASSSLKPGQEIAILPISGVLHVVRPHDTLSEIASWYKAGMQDILDFNNLSSAESIFAGDILIIPNGIMPKSLPQGRLTPLPNSYFIYPIPVPHYLTQGLHPFNAVDLSNGTCGNPVYAAAGGDVQKTGYTWLGGNYVRIMHPNGVVTYYGHLSAILAQAGQRVFQGQIIGYIGHTGITIPRGPAGCHVHFEVRGAANPFANDPVR